MNKEKSGGIFSPAVIIGAVFLAIIFLLAARLEISRKISDFGGGTYTPPISSSKPVPSPAVLKIQVPDNKSWYEYRPRCEALNKNIQIFFPAGWKTSSEQNVRDGTSAEPGTSEYADFVNKVSECQIITGYKDSPGSYQDPCMQNDYGVVSVGAVRVDSGQDIDYWKDQYTKKSSNNYSWIDSVTEGSLNGRKFLTLNSNNSGFTMYQIINNNYLISVNHFLCMGPGGTNNDNYFKQTGFEIFKRLIFK